ncbi:MAG: MFS transporter [Candidatus Bathyarchaeota archaeon]
MGDTEKDSKITQKIGRLVLPSLALSRFASITPTLIIGLLLVDIADTFQCPVGVAGQLQTASSLAGLVGALILAAISVKYRSSSLLLIGLALLTISALGSYLAPSLSAMLLIFTLSGLGNAIISPMASTLVGERFPPEGRSHAMSWLTAGLSLANVIGAPLIGTVSSLMGWRMVYLLYAFPLFLSILLLVHTALPRSVSPQTTSSVDFLEGFRGVFSSSSAIACLVGYALATASYQSILLYGASFFRQRFLLSTGLVSIITLAGALLFTVGGLASGRLVNKYGRKPVSVFSALAAGLPILSFSNLPDLWISMGVMFLGRFFTGVLVTSVNLLALEQVPRFRGTMMSVGQAASMLGSTIGATVGGWALLVSGYGLIGVILGGMMVLAAVVFQILSKDPLRSSIFTK